jgi:hypothetical protein
MNIADLDNGGAIDAQDEVEQFGVRACSATP